jgi:hypothetical protein
MLGGLISGLQVAGGVPQGYQQTTQNQQQIQQNALNQAGQQLFGQTAQQMFGQAVPGAQPMMQPGQGPQPQQPQQQVNPIQALMQRVAQAGQGQPPQMQPGQGPQPSQGMPPQGMPQGGQPPMQQSAVPGAQPMRPPMPPQGQAPMAPPMGQGGMPPQPQMPPQQPPQGQQGGAPQGGQLSLQSVMQNVVRTAQQSNDPNMKNPAVIAAAINQFMPLMNAQAQQDWRMALAQSNLMRAGAAETQAGAAQTRANAIPDVIAGRADVANINAASRETVANLRPEVKLMHDFYQNNPDATPTEAAQFFAGQVKGGQQRSEDKRYGVDTRAGTAADAEAGRMKRAELSSNTKKELQGLSIQARKEIEAARLAVEGIKEEGRDARFAAGQEGAMNRTVVTQTGASLRERDRQGAMDERAQLSSNTKKELQGLSIQARKELTEYLEGGRQERFGQGLTSRENEGAANRASREGVAAGRLTEQQLQDSWRRQHGDTQTSQGQERIDISKGREARLAESSRARLEQGQQRIDIAKQQLARQANKAKRDGILADLNGELKAQHERTQAEISSMSAGMGAKERKQLMDQEDKVYQGLVEQYKQLRDGGGSTGKGDSQSAPNVIRYDAQGNRVAQ